MDCNLKKLARIVSFGEVAKKINYSLFLIGEGSLRAISR